jgi:uncharacterized cupin superfamily protein
MPRRASFLNESFAYDTSDPSGYRAGQLDVSQLPGARALVVKVFELPCGQSVCPYHYEYEEEWLVVLDGAVLVRTPAGEEALVRGEIVRFSTGPAGAHKVSNVSESTAHVMMFSSAREPSVTVYPDSDKIGVWPGNPEDQVMLRREHGAVDYFDGER